MIVTVQTIEERLSYIRPVMKGFNPKFHVDEQRISAYHSFMDMLDYDVDDYRLHFQDDVILAHELHRYIPTLVEFMDKNKIHFLSLFCPHREHIKTAYLGGARIVRLSNYLCNLGVLFSKYFVDIMRKHKFKTANQKDDDIFIQTVLDRESIPSFVHTPTLLQHNMSLGSSLNHDNTADKMVSDIFDINFVKNKL